MKAKSVLSAALTLALGLGLGVVNPGSALADKPAQKPTAGKTAAKDKGKDAKAEEPAPTLPKPVTIAPKDLAWGIGHKKLEAIYDKVIDDDYKERYRKVQPGPEMEALDAEVAEKKDEFRRSRIDFGSVPTGLDGTPLKTEFTYNNKESLMQITRKGKTRHFFLIQDRLWKIIDEFPVGEKAEWGKDFTEVAVKLTKAYGVPGRVREPDPAAGRPFTEIDWRDTSTEVRAIDWQIGKFGLAFQDAATVANLSSLRPNKSLQSGGVDASVQDVLRTPSSPPELPDKTKKDDKKNPKVTKGNPPKK